MHISQLAARCVSVAVSLGLSACVSQSTARDYSEVRELAETRAALHLPEHLSAAGDDDSDAAVKALRDRPLTEQGAVRIALLNNHDLRAELEELGIARGQLVQASLFPNLDVDVAMRVPEKSGEPLDWDLGARFNLTSLILRGARTGIGEAELEVARYHAAEAMLDLGFRVRDAYYAVVASSQRLELMQTALAAFAAGYETATVLHEAGNTTALDLATEHAAYEAARVAVSEAEADVLDDRERLNVLLGLHGREVAWQAVNHLPDPPADAPDEEHVETRAIEASLDLAETRAGLEALGRRVGFAQNASVVPDLSLGVEAERDDGDWAVGPQLRATLPLFNRQQGNVVSNRARFDQLRERYIAMAVNIRSTARAERDRAASAQLRARHYRELVLPARQVVMEQTLQQYNAMQVGVFQLLQARRDQLDTASMYIDTLHEYWRTRAKLELVLAGRLPRPTDVTASREPRSRAIPTLAGSARD